MKPVVKNVCFVIFTADDIDLNNETVIEHMLQLPGVDRNAVINSVHNLRFDHYSAIYYLLLDELEKDEKSLSLLSHNLPVLTQPPRRCSSITTGVGKFAPFG